MWTLINSSSKINIIILIYILKLSFYDWFNSIIILLLDLTGKKMANINKKNCHITWKIGIRLKCLKNSQLIEFCWLNRAEYNYV